MYSPPGCNQTVVEHTTNHVFVDIRSPTSVFVDYISTLTFPSDPVSQLFTDSVPTNTQLRVYLKLDSNITQDMSNDPRTQYDVSGAGDLFYIKNNSNNDTAIFVNNTSTLKNIGGSASLDIYFTHLSMHKTIFFDIVVSLPNISLLVNPLPVFNGSQQIDLKQLAMYSETGVYQKGVLRLILPLSNNDFRDISLEPQTIFFTFPANTIIQITSDLNVSKAINGLVGTVDIIAQYYNLTVKIPFLVTSTKLLLVKLINYDYANEVNDLVSTYTRPSLGAIFFDGINFIEYPTLFSLSPNETPGIYLPGLVTFHSSVPTVAFVDAQSGVVTLLANYFTVINLTVTSTSNASLFLFTSFTVNLAPGVGDIDMGVFIF